MNLLKRIFASVFVLGIGISDSGSSHAVGNDDRLFQASETISALDLPRARQLLEGLDAGDPRVVYEKARLAIYEGRCDDASIILARELPELKEERAVLGEIARGCARVTSLAHVETDAAAGIEYRFQDADDKVLQWLLTETIVSARDMLTKDIGAVWPKPTRIVVVRDLLSLSAMTGLPYKSAQTTGTVAVAKWGRVTILSPRASRNGYGFRDTLAHELTHLAITERTHDRAPLWFQEGLAKREEVRWREPTPFDSKPPSDSIVLRGIELKLDRPLNQLGPSIAMLKSPDAALVAYAEVASFMNFLVSSSEPQTFAQILNGFRDGKETEDALTSATGLSFSAWDSAWRASLTKQTHAPLSDLFGLGTPPPDAREMRERMRLSELLLARNHPAAVIQELDRIKLPSALDDASVRAMRGDALELLDRAKDAELLVRDPADVLSSFGPWWALRGRLALARSDTEMADQAFQQAVAIDPFGVSGSCEGLLEKSVPRDPKRRPLCDEARRWSHLPAGWE